MPITDRQQAFCKEYVKDWNCVRAMLAAGYTSKYANHYNTKILGQVGVKHEISVYKAKQAAKHTTTIDELVQELRKYAGIAGEKDNKPGSTVDRIKSIELLGRHLGMFIERAINLNANIPQEPEAYRARLQAEIDRTADTASLAGKYDKALPAIAQRY